MSGTNVHAVLEQAPEPLVEGDAVAAVDSGQLVFPVTSSSAEGLRWTSQRLADWVEAAAFAWLAKQTIDHKPSNLPAVTGAKGLRMLGAIYSA
jgi:acyl transferase domain-containing protein